MYHISCFIHLSQNMLHLSHLYTGLCALPGQRLGTVELVRSKRPPAYASDPVALWTEVTALRTGEHLRIVFDMYDSSKAFAIDALERSDVYFKRNFYRPDVEQLSAELRAKVQPFGVNYPCRTGTSLWATMSRLAIDYVKELLRSPLRTARLVRTRDLYYFLLDPTVSAFEQGPRHPVYPGVHFQTRLWDEQSLGPDSHEKVNRPRVELTRLLKSRFGSLFFGGIVPTDFARRHCPKDLLSRESTRRRRYIAQSKKPMIGIYTRGLHHSIAFKLGEYLASSKCIVTEPLRNELPSPLTAGENYLEFATPEECVERCEQLLEDKRLAERMRRSNWEYYQREVRPDRHLALCLERAFGLTRCNTRARAALLDRSAVTHFSQPLQAGRR